MQQNPIDKEIDLLELLAKVIITLKRNKALVILCPIVGLLLGLTFFYIKHNGTSALIRSEMMISTDLLTEVEAKFLSANLMDANILPNLTAEQRSKIISTSINTEKEAVSDVKNLVLINISVVVNNQSVLPVLQEALLNYLNKSEPVARVWNTRKRLNTEMIKKIDKTIATIEQSNSKNTSSELNLLITDLTERKLSYQISLEEKYAVHLVKGFENSAPYTASKLLYALVGLSLGICMVILVLFIRFFVHYYKQFESVAH